MSYLLIPVAAKRSRFKTTSLLSLVENIKRSEIAKCFLGHNESPARFFLLHFHQQTAPASHDSAYILHQLRKHPKFFPKEAAWFESHSLINESAFSLSTFAFALTSYFAKHLSRWLLSSASEFFCLRDDGDISLGLCMALKTKRKIISDRIISAVFFLSNMTQFNL